MAIVNHRWFPDDPYENFLARHWDWPEDRPINIFKFQRDHHTRMFRLTVRHHAGFYPKQYADQVWSKALGMRFKIAKTRR